jgi:hypothetical protein
MCCRTCACNAMWLMKRRAATISLGHWPFAAGPRVLIEHPDPDRALELAGAIRQAGCTVGICRGPGAAGDPRCPVHRLEPCVAVEGAEVVVTVLDFADPYAREVLQGLRTRYPSKPLVVAATVAQSLELRDALEGCAVVPVDGEPDRFAAAVLAALGERRPRTKGAR